MSGWFITGTDTGVGKTLVTAALLSLLAARGMRVVGMKPVASGCYEGPDGRRNEDADALHEMSNVAVDYQLACPYRFLPPIAPHLAADEEGIQIDSELILANYRQLERQADRVLVEGVGGWQVPLAEDLAMPDIARAIGLPVILVVGGRLGCINHALLTRDAIAASGLSLDGWVYNQVDADMQRATAVLQALRSRIDAPLLGALPWLAQPTPSGVAEHLALP
jgi:dethiobiotin synthetase